ncbi:MAG: hypothetical protein OXU40_05290 [Nitrospira sp.]|nr:hypothetical protein [Nitrospira sp.]
MHTTVSNTHKIRKLFTCCAFFQYAFEANIVIVCLVYLHVILFDDLSFPH